MKILILCKSQLGYHIDTWYYCKYLSEHNDVSYICFDFNKKKYALAGVNVVYVSRKGNSIVRMYYFLRVIFDYISRNKPDIVFIKYFAGCSVLKLFFPKVNFVFDIRTADVSNNKMKRHLKDYVLKLEAVPFKNISIISDSLAGKLKFNREYYLLPLGAELNEDTRFYDQVLRVLYVGTFTGRDLHKVLHGLQMFINHNIEKNIHITFIGDGWGNELNELKEISQELLISQYVTFTGFLHHNDIIDYIRTSSVGLSFVPITSYFDKQPVTKTYEYLLAGMPVIATDTFENRKVINEKNGILICDTPQDVAHALRWCFDFVQSGVVNVHARDYEQFSWKSIVQNLEKKFNNIAVANKR